MDRRSELGLESREPAGAPARNEGPGQMMAVALEQQAALAGRARRVETGDRPERLSPAAAAVRTELKETVRQLVQSGAWDGVALLY